MAAELLRDLSRASDANNNPLAGAQWFFYVSGTTTPQAVYADAGLITSLGAFVTADGGGQFEPIYQDATKLYRGILKNAAGTTIHDIDPINSGVLAVLSGNGGVGLLGFLQAGRGMVARTVEAKAREALSIGDALPAADGATDDTTKFNAVLTEASNRGGAQIFCPPGDYALTSLTIPEGVRLVGPGNGGHSGEATLIGTALTGPVILMPNRNSGIQGFTITSSDARWNSATPTDGHGGRHSGCARPHTANGFATISSSANLWMASMASARSSTPIS